MRRDQLNDEYLELLDKRRLYFKTVKDFKEVLHKLHKSGIRVWAGSSFQSVKLCPLRFHITHTFTALWLASCPHFVMHRNTWMGS